MIKHYTYLTFTDFVYIRLKGLVWTYNGLTNPNNIDKSAGDAINEIYINVEPSKPLILDCKGIVGITDHAWDIFFSSIEKNKREVAFINFLKIDQQINFSKKEFCSSLKTWSDDLSIIIFSERKKLDIISGTYLEIDKQILKKISDFVGNSFYRYEGGQMKPLSSTPIYSNGEFDAAQIISIPESFFWTSIRMADEVEKIIEENRIGAVNAPACLLTVSLRSSPIAAAIGLLLGLNIETVDHFGPIFRNAEGDLSSSMIYEYIYIGDFTVGGTEIKVSKTYAHMKNCKLAHAVVIGSALEKELFKEFQLHPLVLLRKCCDNVEYSIPK